jgi:hypothetical protein
VHCDTACGPGLLVALVQLIQTRTPSLADPVAPLLYCGGVLRLQEYSVATKQLLNFAVVACTFCNLLVGLIEPIPIWVTVVAVVAHGAYLNTLQTFPVLETGPSFYGSCLLILLHNYLAFTTFADTWFPFDEVCHTGWGCLQCPTVLVLSRILCESLNPSTHLALDLLAHTRFPLSHPLCAHTTLLQPNRSPDCCGTFRLQFLAYFVICVWLVPFGLFVSLSVNDNVLPTHGGPASSSSNGQPHGSKGNRSGLLVAFDSVRNIASDVIG